MATYRGDEGAREILVNMSGSGRVRIAGFLAAILAGIIFVSWCVVTVPTGHVGVLTRFGRVTGTTLGEGIHMINPIDKVTQMDVRVRTVKESAPVPSNEGLNLILDVSLVYRLRPESAGNVLGSLGLGYETGLIESSSRSAIRFATSQHTANALYSGARTEVAGQIKDELIKDLGPRGFEIQDVLLRDIQLPATLRTSIEAKQRAEQEALQMSFVLQKEKQEAERKRIEAQGIADFQRIVAAGISPQLLTWKGIEATEKLAASSNAKIIMIGNAKTGLPLVMDASK